ncbi:MAG TPA: type III pantothenate kinase [Lachnoclostridium phytofermentans]|uniref:Type III pantothenate kinase n=1 Tax=Lachnoclostridium phytofermentans TaxID=66219 RepID=A0A3D2X506_9FIRM|nr:type III pantothenate kinase [Lachnoclostridium sp.]HCL02192.1 type III pantothenate kinase [Lachnoclostridium phytofermentans]
MLLVIDVGNTNITLGVFDEDKIVGTYRITTKVSRTSDEFGLLFCDLLHVKEIERTSIDSVIIASVVPAIMYSLTSAIIKYLGITPLIIGAGTKTGIKILTANAKEVGADRIVDLVAAFEEYRGPVFVIDFGTATTYDLVTEDGKFTAGITSPGIRISANALWNDTAKLPEIEILKPDSILAKDTVSSMQAGLVYGTIGATEYIIKKVKEESKLENLKVVATGGLGKIIADATDMIDIYDPNLTLKGLRYIYLKNS